MDEAWVVEHAKEVQRMMPGGLCVMGVFFFCPSDQVGRCLRLSLCRGRARAC